MDITFLCGKMINRCRGLISLVHKEGIKMIKHVIINPFFATGSTLVCDYNMLHTMHVEPTKQLFDISYTFLSIPSRFF